MKHPKTPWGKPALGVPTRPVNKASSKFIISSSEASIELISLEY